MKWGAKTRSSLFRIGGKASALLLLLAIAVAILGAACMGGPPSAPTPNPCAGGTLPALDGPPRRVVFVEPDAASETRLAQGKALATATACSLRPGDSITVVAQHDFSTVFSAVVPGDPAILARSPQCAEVPIGGPGPECVAAAQAQADLAAWQAAAVRAIESVSLPANARGTDDCRAESGLPRDRFVQLLLGLQPEQGQVSAAVLVFGVDADAIGDQAPLTEYVQNVRVIVAPFSLACGDPQNLRAWFRWAASLDLYPAELPPSRFGEFLGRVAQSTRAGVRP